MNGNEVYLHSSIRVVVVQAEEQVEAVFARVVHEIQYCLEALGIYGSRDKILLPQDAPREVGDELVRR